MAGAITSRVTVTESLVFVSDANVDLDLMNSNGVGTLGLQPSPQKVVRPPNHTPTTGHLRRWARSPRGNNFSHAKRESEGSGAPRRNDRNQKLLFGARRAVNRLSLGDVFFLADGCLLMI